MQTGKARTAHLRVCNFWAIYQAFKFSDLRGKKLGIVQTIAHQSAKLVPFVNLAEPMGIPENRLTHRKTLSSAG